MILATSACMVYDNKAHKFINGSPKKIYSHAWDGAEFISTVYDPLSKRYNAETAGNFLYFSEDVEFFFFRSRELVKIFYNNLDEIMQKDLYDIEFELIDGVAGCGKTYTICKTHVQSKDLVLTATTAAKSDYIDKYNKKEYYKTYDSVLLNKTIEAEVIYADEGFMVHFGDLLLCAIKVKAKKVKVYGDSKQIPFISRIAEYEVEYIPDCTKIDYMISTYRLPTSMIPHMLKFYENITTNSTITGSISKNFINAATQVPRGYDIYLTYTQREKTEMKESGFQMCLTIHETYDKVALIRLVPQQDNIYDSAPHTLVALSRHREHFDYYTVFKEDPLWELLGENATVEDKLKKKREKSWTMKINKCIPAVKKQYMIPIEPTNTSLPQFMHHFFAECWIKAIRTYRKVTKYINHYLLNEKTDEKHSYNIIMMQQLIDELYTESTSNWKMYDDIPIKKILESCNIKDLGRFDLEKIESNQKFCNNKLKTTKGV
eukprot:GHVR01083623.1.p1 GENE.GHVR01083623.1~~GHVR01083623.1.p1  ORF type:complete len:489 (+),score=68.22 GHVR01083623.1:193-1659(+)